MASSTTFNEFPKWYEDRKNIGSAVSHTGTFFVGITHSNSLGPWVLDSGATNHITGNKSFFSFISTSGYLPSITTANGFRVSSHAVGTIDRLKARLRLKVIHKF